MEDYTAAAKDLQAVIDNPADFAPIRRRYGWRYGLFDGSPPTARARFPTKLPKSSQMHQESKDEGDSRQVERQIAGASCAAGRSELAAHDRDTVMRGAEIDKSARGGRGNRNHDNDTRISSGARGTRDRERGGRDSLVRDDRKKHARGSERNRGNGNCACKDFFSWPFRWDDTTTKTAMVTTNIRDTGGCLGLPSGASTRKAQFDGTGPAPRQGAPTRTGATVQAVQPRR